MPVNIVSYICFVVVEKGDQREAPLQTTLQVNLRQLFRQFPNNSPGRLKMTPNKSPGKLKTTLQTTNSQGKLETNLQTSNPQGKLKTTLFLSPT